MPQMTINTLLENKIGLSVTTIGTRVLEKALQQRMYACGYRDKRDYVHFLQASQEELNELIEAVVIPETWFFRNRSSFFFLERYLRTEWLPTHKHERLRALSFPCSTGEEPYSIAMTLFDVGMSAEQFQIDAVDISRKVLQKAAKGCYGEESFRNKETLVWRDRYFHAHRKKYEIHAALKAPVRFLWGNILESGRLTIESGYHIIFCRNLLIYLSPSAKKQAVGMLKERLVDNGLLFVGHAERSMFDGPDCDWIRQAGVFACRRKIINSVQPVSPKQAPPLSYRFERRNSQSRPLKKAKESAVFASESLLGLAEKRKMPNGGIERRRPSDKVICLLDEARRLADRGNLREALALCEQSLSQTPTDVQANFLSGLIWLALGEEAKAEAFLNKTLYLDPNHHDALNYLTVIAEHRGEQGRVTLLRQRGERILKKRQAL